MLSSVDPDHPPLAVIYSFSGPVLTEDERRFFAETNPLGFILFARNCNNPKQLKALTNDLHDCLGREAPILIDQEGGRIQRMKSPQWHDYPPPLSFADKTTEELEKRITAMAAELAEHGINVDCAPVLDVLRPETHDVIGDRALSDDPEKVAELGKIVCQAFVRQGVIPVIKHIPGHGRATTDSHKELPVVDASLEELDKTDFLPFREVLKTPFADVIWGMTAHLLYTAIDDQRVASCSPLVIEDIVRGRMGFDGLLISDALDMNALDQSESPGKRTEQVLKAGCDIALSCTGERAEMESVANAAQKMTNAAVTRYNRSILWLEQQMKHDNRRAV